MANAPIPRAVRSVSRTNEDAAAGVVLAIAVATPAKPPEETPGNDARGGSGFGTVDTRGA